MGNLHEVHVYGIIFNSKKQALWIKSTGGKKMFMFPGGTLEKGESVKECLLREIKEETNLSAKIIAPIFSETLPNKTPPQLGIIYLCKNPKGDLKLSEENDEFLWADPYKINSKIVAHPALISAAKQAKKMLKNQ